MWQLSETSDTADNMEQPQWQQGQALRYGAHFSILHLCYLYLSCSANELRNDIPTGSVSLVN